MLAALAAPAVVAQTPNLNPQPNAVSISALLFGSPEQQKSEVAKAAPQAAGEDAADVASDEKKLDIGPLRLTFGPTEDGFYGTTLKGEGRHIFRELSTAPLNWLAKEPGSITGYTTSLGYVVDGGWAGGDEANNNVSVNLRPGLDWLWMRSEQDYRAVTPETARKVLEDSKERLEKCRQTVSVQLKPVRVRDCVTLIFPQPRLSIGIFGDLRYRYGYFTQDEQRVSVNQAILGAGLRMTRFTPDLGWVNSWPRLSVGYYTVKDTETSSGEVPDDIESDVIKLDASTKFNLWKRGSTNGGQDYAIRLYLDIEASKPTEGDDRDWQALYQAQLLFKTDGDFKPALTYRDGEEQGLDYDKQVIFGILYELAAG
ncbi:MAG: hypothetical protein ACT4QA_14955 [Panacagrimonas sp.]